MLTLLFTLACSTSSEPEVTAPAPTTSAAPTPPPASEGQYVCPMHPDVTSTEPGECSECGMALVKSEADDHSGHEHPEEEHHAGHDEADGH